jgi:hypothetical protein
LDAEKPYPEASLFGVLPAGGLFIRHARNLEFTNVQIATAKHDARPGIRAKDVEGLFDPPPPGRRWINHLS